MALSPGDQLLVENGGITAAERASLPAATVAKIDAANPACAPGGALAKKADALNASGKKPPADKQKDTNAKLPVQPLKDTFEAKYPFVHVEQGHNGDRKVTIADPTSPDSKTATYHMPHSGGFKADVFSKAFKGLHLDHSPGEHRVNRNGGHSENVEGHHDSAHQGTSNQNVKGDTAAQSGGKALKGAQAEVGGANESAFHHSNGNKYHTSKGDIVEDNTGSFHRTNTGDVVDSIKGNFSHMVTGGDHSLNVQGGSMDVLVSKGKTRIKSGKEIFITSDVSIELRVGDSFVFLNQDGVSIRSTGFLNIFATGSQNIVVDNQGSGKVGILSASSEVVISGKTNKIVSAQGSKFETSNAPPAGQVRPTYNQR
jgi:hypothetical protein